MWAGFRHNSGVVGGGGPLNQSPRPILCLSGLNRRPWPSLDASYGLGTVLLGAAGPFGLLAGTPFTSLEQFCHAARLVRVRSIENSGRPRQRSRFGTNHEAGPRNGHRAQLSEPIIPRPSSRSEAQALRSKARFTDLVPHSLKASARPGACTKRLPVASAWRRQPVAGFSCPQRWSCPRISRKACPAPGLPAIRGPTINASARTGQAPSAPHHEPWLMPPLATWLKESVGKAAIMAHWAPGCGS